jgi:hypothetical protein
MTARPPMARSAGQPHGIRLSPGEGEATLQDVVKTDLVRDA